MLKTPHSNGENKERPPLAVTFIDIYRILQCDQRSTGHVIRTEFAMSMRFSKGKSGHPWRYLIEQGGSAHST